MVFGILVTFSTEMVFAGVYYAMEDASPYVDVYGSPENASLLGLALGFVWGLFYGPISALIFWIGGGILFKLFSLSIQGIESLGVLQSAWIKSKKVILLVFVGALSGTIFGSGILGPMISFAIGDILTGAGAFGASIGAITGLSIGLSIGISIAQSDKIEVVDALDWSWAKAKISVVLGLISMLVGWFLVPKIPFAIFVGIIIFFFYGLGKSKIEENAKPGQGIKLSLRYAILSFIVFGFLGGIILGILAGGINAFGTIMLGPILGLIIGFIGGLIKFGGNTVIQHYVLQSIIRKKHFLPKRLIPFLDYATELTFFRKVGGGYIFTHRTLMEHFAETGLESIDRKS